MPLFLPFKPAKAQDPPRRQRQHVQSFVHQEKFRLQASGCAEYEATAPIPLACKHLQKQRWKFRRANQSGQVMGADLHYKQLFEKNNPEKKKRSTYCDCTDISLWFLEMFNLHPLWLCTIIWSQDKSSHLHNDCSLNGTAGEVSTGRHALWLKIKILLRISIPRKSVHGRSD